MLSHVAQMDSYANETQKSTASPQKDVGLGSAGIGSSETFASGILQYELVSRGALTTDQVKQLLARYDGAIIPSASHTDAIVHLASNCTTTHIFLSLQEDHLSQIRFSIWQLVNHIY